MQSEKDLSHLLIFIQSGGVSMRKEIDRSKRSKGFHPGLDLKSCCHKLYFHVENQESEYSSKVVFIMKTVKGYEGLIRMSSKSEILLMTSVNERLNDLVEDLYGQFSKKYLNGNSSKISKNKL